MHNSDYFSYKLIGDRYRCINRIGSGGMSQVFLAVDTHIKKEWAVKLIEVRGDTTLLNSEIATLKSLDYPMFPRITDAFREGNKIAIVTDFIEGETMERHLAREGPFSTGKALDYFIELLFALDYLHNKDGGILYLDMKPSNIMISKDGKIKLIDFGIATNILTKSRCFGSVGYAPPEQYETDILLTEKSDVFAVGMTLYSMLSARAPARELHRQREIIKSDKSIPKNIRKLILKCTEPNYRNRPEIREILSHLKKRTIDIRQIISLSISAIIISLIFALSVCSIRNSYKKNRKSRYAEEMLNRVSSHMNGNEYTLAAIRIMCGYIDGNFLEEEVKARYAYEVAKYYFEVEKDYSLSKHYFNVAGEKDYPETRYYEALCEYMVSFEVPIEEVKEYLKRIERINMKIPEGKRKDNNNELIDFIYKELDIKEET